MMTFLTRRLSSTLEIGLSCTPHLKCWLLCLASVKHLSIWTSCIPCGHSGAEVQPSASILAVLVDGTSILRVWASLPRTGHGRTNLTSQCSEAAEPAERETPW